MTELVYYQKYLTKIDECLSIENNPDIAISARNILNQILDRYKSLNYKASYFEGHFNSFFETLKRHTYSSEVEELIKEARDFFNEDTHNDFQILSMKLERLEKISRSTDDDELKTKISNLLYNVGSEDYLGDAEIENYKRGAQYLIDEYTYSTSQSVTQVIEKKQKQNKGCLLAIIFIIPNLIKNLITW